MLKKRYFAIIGIALFAWILWNSDIPGILSRLSSVSPYWLAAAVIAGLATLAVKGYRWKLLLGIVSGKGQARMPSWKAAEYFTIGFFWSILTPGRVGDFIRAIYAKNYNGSLARGLSSVVIDRLIDVVFLFALGLVGILAFSFWFGAEIISLSLIIILIILLAALIFVFLNKGLMKALLRPFFLAFVPKAQKQRMAEGFSSFYDALSNAGSNAGTFAKAIALTAASWAISIASAYFLSLSFGFSIPLQFYAIVVPVLGLLDLVPISISGIGTRDAALIFLFSFYKVGAEGAIAFSIVYLFAFYWLVAVLGAILFAREPAKLEVFS